MFGWRGRHTHIHTHCKTHWRNRRERERESERAEEVLVITRATRARKREAAPAAVGEPVWGHRIPPSCAATRLSRARDAPAFSSLSLSVTHIHTYIYTRLFPSMREAPDYAWTDIVYDGRCPFFFFSYGIFFFFIFEGVTETFEWCGKLNGSIYI